MPKENQIRNVSRKKFYAKPGNELSHIARLIFHKTELCRNHIQGKCGNGDGCRYAHGVEELRESCDLRRTKICPIMKAEGQCRFGDKCKFAHSEAQPSHSDPFFRVILCRNFMKDGRCSSGSTCRFAHGNAALREVPPHLKIEAPRLDNPPENKEPKETSRVEVNLNQQRETLRSSGANPAELDTGERSSHRHDGGLQVFIERALPTDQACLSPRASPSRALISGPVLVGNKLLFAKIDSSPRGYFFEEWTHVDISPNILYRETKEMMEAQPDRHFCTRSRVVELPKEHKSDDDSLSSLRAPRKNQFRGF